MRRYEPLRRSHWTGGAGAGVEKLGEEEGKKERKKKGEPRTSLRQGITRRRKDMKKINGK